MRQFTRRVSHLSTPEEGSTQVQTNSDGVLEEVTPLRKKTQHDQDEADEKARAKAMKDLVQSWMDRLQLITLITTFLASVEASMLQVTMPSDDPSTQSNWLQASNASFFASLVLHLHASFVSFFASFFLVRFKVHEAKREEKQVEGGNPAHPPPSKGSVVLDMAAHQVTNSPKSVSPRSTSSTPSHIANANTNNASAPQEKPDKGRQSPPIWSANPQLVQTGPFQRQPPINLLSRCHTLCLITAALGFVLALVGAVCYTWDRQPLSISIVTTATVGVTTLSFIGIIMPRQSEPSPHLFTYSSS